MNLQFVKWRYVMSVLLSIGLAIIYGLRVNLSVVIVSMVNHSALQSQGYSAMMETLIKKVDGPFVWSPSQQGNLLSSYYYGYLVAMFPGSQMAEIASAKWVFFFAVALNIICTMATPIACRLHYALMFAIRVGEGIGGGVTFPTTHVLLAKWAPPNERSTMASIAFSGTILGTVISNYMSGIVSVYLGWRWVFYIMGGLSMVWLVLWVLFVTDKPRQLRYIGENEVTYIETALGQTSAKKVKRKVPWLAILKSIPFWAILVAHTCSNWGFYLLLTNMPLYMSAILKFSVEETSRYSAIPYFIMWMFSIAVGRTFDYLRKKEKISTTNVRKVATIIASAPVMVCLILLCFFGTNKVVAVILLTASLTAMGAMYTGFMTNHIDVAPNFAGTLMGMTNTFGTVPGIVGPVFVGAMTEKENSLNSWRVIYGVTCGIFLVEIVVFTIFGTGKEQPWNEIQEQTEQAEPTESTQ